MFRQLLLLGSHTVLVSALSTVEVERAFSAARRARRFSADTIGGAEKGFPEVAAVRRRIRLIPLDARPTLRRAAELVREHPLGTLDAIHLAVADREGRALAGDDELVFVTADAAQATAARALGLSVRP